MHRSLLAIGKPVATVSAVVYSDYSTELVKNYCYAKAVGGEVTGVFLGEYPNCLVCCGLGGDGLVNSPLAFGCGKGLRTDLDGQLGRCILKTGDIKLLVEEVAAVKTNLTSLVTVVTVGEYHEVLALLELGPCYGCISTGSEVHRSLLAIGKPVATVSTVVYSDNSAVLIKNNCYAVGVGRELTDIILGEYPNALICCGSGGDGLVDSPRAYYCLILLGADGNEHGSCVTCALLGACCLEALCIGTLAAVLANALTLVASALLSANSLGASYILALATGRTNALTLVSVALALLCANLVSALRGTLAALRTYVLAHMRSIGEGDTGDAQLSTYGTVGKEERTGKVASSSVRSNDHILACLKGSECLLEVVSSSTLGRINDACLVVCIIVLTVSTVVNTNDLTVLVKDERLTPTVRPVESAVVVGCIYYEEVTAKNGEILVDRDLLGKKVIVLIAYGNAYEIVNNLNNSVYGYGVNAVGSGKSYGVRAYSIYVEAAVVCNGDLNGGIVGRIEGAVIIGNGKTAEDSCSKIELSIGKVSKNLVVVTGDHGSLVNVRSENLLGVSPKKTNNVAVLIDYVVVHEATAVVVNGSAAVTVLNYDCIAACGNGKVLRKCRCNGNSLTVNLNRGY